jgi:hypothetical protein
VADAQTISLPDSKAHQDLSRDTAIVIPNGYFLSLEYLWWVQDFGSKGLCQKPGAPKSLP